jgi:hypothetical protein
VDVEALELLLDRVDEARKLARSCVCSVTIVPWREITNSRSTLPLQPGGWTGPKSITVPTSSDARTARAAVLPAESSAGPVDDVSPPVELPLVDADTLVIAGPVENPGGPRPRRRRGSGRRGWARAWPHKPNPGPARCQLVQHVEHPPQRVGIDPSAHTHQDAADSQLDHAALGPPGTARAHVDRRLLPASSRRRSGRSRWGVVVEATAVSVRRRWKR